MRAVVDLLVVLAQTGLLGLGLAAILVPECWWVARWTERDERDKASSGDGDDVSEAARTCQQVSSTIAATR